MKPSGLRYLLVYAHGLNNIPFPSYNPKPPKQKVELGAIIRLCPGGHHAWFESNIGPVRKPFCLSPGGRK